MMYDCTGDRSHRGWARRLRRRYPVSGRILASTVAVSLVIPLCMAAWLYRDGWGAWLYPPLRWLWFVGALFISLAGLWLLVRGPVPGAGARRQDRLETAVVAATSVCIAGALAFDRLDVAVHAAYAFCPLTMAAVACVRRRPMDVTDVVVRVPVSAALAVARPDLVIATLGVGLVWRAVHRAPLAHALMDKLSRQEFVARAKRPG